MDDQLEPFQLKRKVTPGLIDVHPTECAIIVNYSVQATILGDNGQPVVGDKKAAQKIIRVKALHENSDLATLAQEVVSKCKLIHPSKTKDIEQLLYYLQQRQAETGSDSWMRKQFDDGRRQETPNPSMISAEMSNIEEYIEGLYEEIPDKIKSTRMILQLARIPENMESLMKNDSLISALSRVIREDGKKSMELVTNIIYIFFCFSNFSQFHPIITQNKIGDMCIKITDQEITRFNLWEKDLRSLELKCTQQKESVKELEQEIKKFQAMIQKQDQLLFVSFHLLLNIAEDLNIETKMLKRGIIEYLITMLDRTTPELLILVITFLKKLSIVRENKDKLVKYSDELIPKLSKLLQSEHLGIQNLSLRLLLNLSHDTKFRMELIKADFLPKLAESLHNKNHLLLNLQLLYMLSIDESSKPYFLSQEIIPMVTKMILEYKSEKVNIELMSLAINISLNPKNAEAMCENQGLKYLMKRTLKTRDPLMFKLIRNLACIEKISIKMMFLDYIDDLMHILFKYQSSPDITVEILGILSSLTIPDFDFAKLAATYNLLEFTFARLSASISASASAISQRAGMNADDEQGQKVGGIAEDDDVTLEIICLLGTMSNDENIPPMILKMNLIPVLMELMIAKEEDDEIILQIIYTMYQLLLHESTRNVLLSKTDVVSYFIDLLYDRNIEIRKMCDVCLDIIAEIDEEWVKKIRLQKFRWHNAEWLQIMSQQNESGQNHEGFEESTVLYAKTRMVNPDRYVEDSESESEDERHGSMIGGTSALLDGP
ncbi:Kinesin-associated protein 3 [Nowakowskiella sp. JEL0407]|nr:Kinesin-associated protein 3 [Nowakowskiella sp. JEL0407]